MGIAGLINKHKAVHRFLGGDTNTNSIEVPRHLFFWVVWGGGNIDFLTLLLTLAEVCVPTQLGLWSWAMLIYTLCVRVRVCACLHAASGC